MHVLIIYGLLCSYFSLICSDLESHKQKTAEVFFSTYGYQEFLMEQYIPTCKHARLLSLASEVRSLHSSFCQSVISGGVLRKETSNGLISVRNPYSCRLNTDWVSSIV